MLLRRIFLEIIPPEGTHSLSSESLISLRDLSSSDIIIHSLDGEILLSIPQARRGTKSSGLDIGRAF